MSKRSVREFGVVARRMLPEWHSWAAMWARCTNVNNKYFMNYGGRGITVCERWKDFLLFLDDMGRKPSAKHTIERKNNDGHYCPENCIWATRTQQMRNVSSNHLITFEGETHCLTEWAELKGLPNHVLFHRIHRGWTVERALLTPGRKFATGKLFESAGQSDTLSGWSRRLGVPCVKLWYHVVKHGRSIEEAAQRIALQRSLANGDSGKVH